MKPAPEIDCIAISKTPFQKRVDFASSKNFCQTMGMSLLSPPGTGGLISTSVYERILLRLQTEARSKRKRTMVWIELVRIPFVEWDRNSFMNQVELQPVSETFWHKSRKFKSNQNWNSPPEPDRRRRQRDWRLGSRRT